MPLQYCSILNIISLAKLEKKCRENYLVGILWSLCWLNNHGRTMYSTDTISKSRMVWVDCLRLVAGLSMVGRHASSDIAGKSLPGLEVSDRIGLL